MELFLCVAKLLAQLSQLGFQFIPSPANLASLMFDACAAFGFFRQLLGQTLELLLHFRPRRQQLLCLCFQPDLFGAGAFLL